MDKHLKLDKELADALGWNDVASGRYTQQNWIKTDNHTLTGIHPQNGCRCLVPRWTQDDGACFQLINEHEVSVIHFATGVSSDLRGSTWYADFDGDKDAACRVAVVQAVIAKLKQEKK